MRPGVVGRQSQAAARAVLEARLHGIVKRLRIRHDPYDRPEGRIEILPDKRIEGVGFSHAHQVIAARAHIHQFENRVPRDLALQIQVVLQG